MSGAVDVLLPLPLNQAYTYGVSSPWSVGDFVQVEFGRRRIWGVIAGPGTADISDLKPILKKYEGWRLPLISYDFLRWVSDYTLAPLGLVLKMVCPVPSALEDPHQIISYRFQDTQGHLSPSQKRIQALLEKGPKALADIVHLSQTRWSVVKSLILKGILVPVEGQIPDELPKIVMPKISAVELSRDQKQAAQSLICAVENPDFSVTVLEGVTGSGKTQVYFDAIDRVLAKGKQVLVLVPEIALTVQWIQQFRKRFGGEPIVWHGELSPSARKRAWHQVQGPQRSGIIVGARSALFLPYPDLGLIIVDEEHDSSYKQEDGVIYQGRDMAVVRSRLGRIPIILVSATPSLETVWNIQQKRYGLVRLTNRYQAQSPSISLIDRRSLAGSKEQWISEPLQQKVHQALQSGSQVLLYVNRRGYAPVILCPACGVKPSCPQCDIWLVLHESEGRLRCHYCGYQRSKPSRCYPCGWEGSFVPLGTGVERVAEEAALIFPKARIQIVSRDTMASPRAINAFIEAMENREIDILIGTQMVVKGHHFPSLTCVGVIDGDVGWGGCDLRADEKLYQLLRQVAGRSGRGSEPGHVFLQTFSPDHPVLQALCSGDSGAFIDKEMAAREKEGFPPFGRLAAVILSSPVQKRVEQLAFQLAAAIPKDSRVDVWGPVPAHLTRLRGKYRWRFLVKTYRNFPIQLFLKAWLRPAEKQSFVNCRVDVDPLTFV